MLVRIMVESALSFMELSDWRHAEHALLNALACRAIPIQLRRDIKHILITVRSKRYGYQSK